MSLLPDTSEAKSVSLSKASASVAKTVDRVVTDENARATESNKFNIQDLIWSWM